MSNHITNNHSESVKELSISIFQSFWIFWIFITDIFCTAESVIRQKNKSLSNQIKIQSKFKENTSGNILI